ncbi:WXG100 family type VII secretion target [Antrihabitans spumae]|jgi:6 kDa early secretory antigenic target|uniref:ESAT-6-like protein n=1 Tax=Antrihabitans spumae TaxID=3373370 RepID=A0ABW7K8G1_9NOCA
MLDYKFGEIDAMSDSLRSRSVALNETHDELKGYVAALAATWEGQAQANYQSVQRDWDQAHQQLVEVLNKIANVVRDGNSGMQATEGREAMKWA